jgi:hypothetical protein
MNHDPPTSDPDGDLVECIREIEKALEILAGDNAKVPRSWLSRLRGMRSILDRPVPKKARRIAEDVLRITLRELIAEIAKRLLETFIRRFPAYNGGVKEYDSWNRYSNFTRVCRAHTNRARNARKYFCFVSLAA